MRGGFNYGGLRQVYFMRKSDNVNVDVDHQILDLREDCEEDLTDVGHNADLYVVNRQKSTDLIREAHMGGTFRFH